MFRILSKLPFLALTFCLISVLSIQTAQAQSTGYRQGMAEAAAGDKAIVQFYSENGLKPIWTGKDRKSKERRRAFLAALGQASDHALPQIYDADLLTTKLRKVRSERELGRLEVEITKLFLSYAQDIQSGVLVPGQVDDDIKRRPPVRDKLSMLDAFSKSTPRTFLAALPPSHPEYTRLMKQKILLTRVVAAGGWGASVPNGKYELGSSGSGVVALRNRLIAMGYMKRTAKSTFGNELQRAVQKFQAANGLTADGVAGESTIRAINVSAERRLGSVMAAMERERWTNMPRGQRHVWVNIADFSAVIMDNGKETFRTRAVVGSNKSDQRSPEFSDKMEHMVINPSWYVPRSITVKEYLPLMQQNPNAVSHLQMLGPSGRVVSREGIDFASFTASTFPFDLKQPPSRRNALGLVKFMFPNRYNIYLHDTPAKNLFGRERRAFSHGCIRLAQPFDFAYTLLARQTSNPKGFFHATLDRGTEATVPLEQHVPVHLVYRTAFTDARGQLHFRPDVYGRDGKIIDALVRAGVAMPALGS